MAAGIPQKYSVSRQISKSYVASPQLIDEQISSPGSAERRRYRCLLHRSIIDRIPLAFAAPTPALLLLLLMRIVRMLALNVALGTSFFHSLGFGNGSLALVVFFSVKIQQ